MVISLKFRCPAFQKAGYFWGKLTHYRSLRKCSAASNSAKLENKISLIFNCKRSLFRRWPFTLEVARKCGRLFAELRRNDRPMQVIDMVVTATARALTDGIVVTADSDLSAVPGLKVEDWTK